MVTSEPKKQRGILSEFFPMIRSREEIRKEIEARSDLSNMFRQWDTRWQEEFLDFCSGQKGLKVVYDGVFKEIFNPEIMPERLEELLSLLLGRQVMIEAVLPNDSVRLGAESSLLYTDIIVRQKDGSLIDVEIQKIGYAFPGERSACYSADHLLRQYKRIRGEKGRYFRYRDIKNVYTIVFFEKSPKEFHAFPNEYIHHFKQRSDTGLEMELLQEYIFISLDFYQKNMDNRPVQNNLEAWLAFLSFDQPERIAELITRYPRFKALYQDIYELCRNTERVMEMYSKELAEMDRNTVKYMMDEMQEEINQAKEELSRKSEELSQKSEELSQKDAELNQKDAIILKLQEELSALQRKQG